MTTLRKVDVCAFWSARIFAALLVFFTINSGRIVASAIYKSYTTMHHWHPLLTITLESELTMVGAVAFGCLSVYFSRALISRIYLFAFGAFFFLGGSLASLSFPGAGWKTGVVTAALGFASFMWVAIRPHAIVPKPSLYVRR